MIFQVCAHEVRIDGMGDIGRDHETICIHLGYVVWPTVLVGKGFADSLESAWKKVAMGTLAKQRTNLLIVEAPDYFDGAGTGIVKAGGNRSLDSGKGTEFVIDTASEDEFLVQAAQLGRLSIEELQFPVDNAAIWSMLINMSV